jgi:predicted metal-dependent peptidase
MKSQLSRARTQLVLDHPFFGSLALRLSLVEDESTKTAFTDGVVIGYNPAFTGTLDLAQTKWLLAHEVMHVACMHHTRREDRDIDRWNVAADYAINGILEEAGFKAPEGFLLNPDFTGKSAEAIYALLPHQAACAAMAAWGEVRDAPGNLKQAEATGRVQMAQAAQQAKTMGDLPGSIRELVLQTLYPPLDWREILRHFIEVIAQKDYSWLCPSRRYLHHGIYLPGLYSKELGPIVIAIDTSGSIDLDALNRFASEVSAVLETFDTSIDVLYCDTKIRGHERYGQQDLPLTLEPKGGGGTDFRPVFDWVGKKDMTPCCLVYLTDLECHRFPLRSPDYPVLWVQTEGRDRQVPFGDIVKLI